MMVGFASPTWARLTSLSSLNIAVTDVELATELGPHTRPARLVRYREPIATAFRSAPRNGYSRALSWA